MGWTSRRRSRSTSRSCRATTRTTAASSLVCRRRRLRIRVWRRCRRPRIRRRSTTSTSCASRTKCITSSRTTSATSRTTRTLTATTSLVALLGHPVSHSLSPRMQNAAFAARALDGEYVACDVEPDALETAVRGLVALGFRGANVTIPHKQAAAQLCDEAEGDAVNTLVFRGGRINGFNTDKEIVAGIEARTVCLIGDGGAARALVPGLSGDVRTFSRRGDWPPSADGADLIVNATPVRDELLVEPRAGQTLVELAYCTDGRATALVEAARAAGCDVVDGLEALVRQGAASFELWTGVAPPVDVMRAAVRSA